MSEPELSRRKVLSSLAVAGGAGSLVGGGSGAFVTNALFTDDETFAGNTLQSSENIGGVVDMDVTLEELADRDGVRYRISLPATSSGSVNNPAYIWLRTLQCPSPEELAARVKILPRISYDGGESYVDLFETEKSVLEALDEIRTGIQLGQWAEEPCLQPGGEWLLDVEVTDVEPKGGGTGSGAGDTQLTFEVEFYGQQCRYQSGSTNPFDPDSVIDECGSSSTGGKGISFVAFCGESGMEPTVTVPEDAERDSDGAPKSLTWTTQADVTYVSVKAGNNWTIYDYSEESKTTGTVETGGDPESAFFGYVNPQGGTASAPCQVAAERDGQSAFNGASVKLEWDEESSAFGDGGEESDD
jgi:hypothetical protein